MMHFRALYVLYVDFIAFQSIIVTGRRHSREIHTSKFLFDYIDGGFA